MYRANEATVFEASILRESYSVSRGQAHLTGYENAAALRKTVCEIKVITLGELLSYKNLKQHNGNTNFKIDKIIRQIIIHSPLVVFPISRYIIFFPQHGKCQGERRLMSHLSV